MNGFDIQHIDGKGRSLIACKSFKEGDTIFEEEPFVSCQFSWNTAYGYAACDYCMRPLETAEENVRRLTNNPTVALPYAELCPTKEWKDQFTECPKCNIRYCSEDCRVEALNKFHASLCQGNFRNDDTHPINVLNETWKKMHYPPESGTIMLVVRLMSMYKQSRNKEKFLETLNSFQSIVVNEEQQIYHKMLGAHFETQLDLLFKTFLNAFNSEDFTMVPRCLYLTPQKSATVYFVFKFSTQTAFKSLMGLIGTNSQGIATSPFAEWVKKATDLKLLPDVETELNNFIDDIYTKLNDFAGEFLNNEGSGLYQIQSKINHSCVPNAQSSFPYSNDILVLKAMRDIQAGEEISISYLDDCQLTRSRHSRQKVLKENYLFLCNCPKCIEQSNDPNETSEDEDDDNSDIDMDDDSEVEMN